MSEPVETRVEILALVTEGEGGRNLQIMRVTEAVTDTELARLYDAVPQGLVDRLPAGGIRVMLSSRFAYSVTTNLLPAHHSVTQELTRALHGTMRDIYRRLRA